MRALLNQAQVASLYLSIMNQYETYGPISRDRRIFYERVTNPSKVHFPAGKPTISFKKVIFPTDNDIKGTKDRNIALLGLANCDAWALSKFYSQFSDTNLLPDKSNLFVAIAECLPDENCFCAKLGLENLAPADLFVRESGSKFEVFALSKKAESIMRKIGVKTDGNKLDPQILKKEDDPLDLAALRIAIDNKESFKQYWQDLSKACFGCGACSTVCPLCFCFRQENINDVGGKTKLCLKWDSCFGKEFSEIQFHRDLRPQNSDRLYNWYHHKFVRSPLDSKETLCTGCGRCIQACPANLSVKNIASALIAKVEKKEEA